MTNTTATTNFASAYVTPTSTSIVDFNALTKAYVMNQAWKFDIHEIFACVNSFLYWTAVQNVQRVGINGQTESFFDANRINCCERADYVENRIQSALSKVIRRCCALNCAISRHGGERFLTCCFKKDETGWYKQEDARRLAVEIAHLYEVNVGKHLMDTRWEFV